MEVRSPTITTMTGCTGADPPGPDSQDPATVTRRRPDRDKRRRPNHHAQRRQRPTDDQDQRPPSRPDQTTTNDDNDRPQSTDDQDQRPPSRPDQTTTTTTDHDQRRLGPAGSHDQNTTTTTTTTTTITGSLPERLDGQVGRQGYNVLHFAVACAVVVIRMYACWQGMMVYILSLVLTDGNGTISCILLWPALLS